MEASERRHHDVATTSAEFASQLDCCLVCFGTGIAEEHLTIPCTSNTHQPVDQHRCLSRDGIREEIADMEKCLRLMRQRPSNSLIGVSQ